MGEIKIEVNKVAGGGGAWINWKREVHIRKETTHPYEVRVGAYLALKEGEEGMRRLQKDGKTTRQQLEQELENRYMKGVLGKPGVCKNPGAMSVKKFDVEKLDEEALEKKIRDFSSGPLIKSRDNPGNGKTEYYFVLLAMSPVQEGKKKGAGEKESQEEAENSPRTEVGVPGLLFTEVGLLSEKSLIAWCD